MDGSASPVPSAPLPPRPDGTGDAIPSRIQTALRFAFVVVLLYGFLAGVKALEVGIRAFGDDFAARLFDNVTHPVAGLMAGMFATVLVQSSSVTSATIVGLVGAGALPLAAAVPMVMGANIGTTITNTLVSMGHIRQGPEFRRAFAGATVHDFFNLLTVLIALPLELTTGFLSRSAVVLTDLLRGGEGVTGVTGDSPISAAVGAPIELLDSALASLGTGWRGGILLAVGLVLILGALTSITKTMRVLMAGGIERSVNRILDKGAGAGAMALGLVVTVLVQSSSITTSILIPMLAAGIITIQNAYPVTLGANVGTTITAILASLAAVSPLGLTVALVHTLFNLFGILLFYPIPAMRQIPLRLAQGLATLAQRNKSWVLAYVGGTFVVLPLIGIFLLA
ncbi:MAG TPA: Na/Pi symporter [Acidimicrobiia bacterium]|nr:Na/Pi symporter [Acidimicrobiia bacterium]